MRKLELGDAIREIAAQTIPWGGVDRRGFVKGLAAAGAGAALVRIFKPRLAAAAPGGASSVFPDGVKAGDPRASGSVIWTRVVPAKEEPSTPVLWVVAEDPELQRVVAGGMPLAEPIDGHSVKVEVQGLRSDRWYYYQFYARGESSAVGRLRTAPERWAQPDRLRYAFASCQQRTDSFYVAHRAIANDDVDFLMHLGDYIYVHDFADITVDDYRRRWRIFHDNPLLQELQARVPLVPMWDDGEFYNGVDATGDPDRLEAAKRAWFEHMPVKRRGRDYRVHRSFAWGRLADVIMIDVRSYRDPEVPNNIERFLIDGLSAQDSAIPPGEQMFAPERTTLGAKQERWLQRRLSRSRSTWRLVGNPYNINPWKFIDRDTPELRAENPDLQRNGGIYAPNEAWDDYQAERRRLLEFIERERIENVIFTSGHTHFYIASELQPDFDDPESPTVGFDFVTGSQTADPDPRTLAPEAVLRGAEDVMLRANDPYMKHIDLLEQGYAVVDVTPDETIVEYRGIDTFDPDAEAYTFARFRIVAGSDSMEVLPVE